MIMEVEMTELAGGCHCGAIRVTLQTPKTVSELGARSCQCGFCRAHSASWTSDPAGTLEIRITGEVNRYRFGSGTADFLVCRTCGVVPAVTCVHDGALRGVVRVDCLEQRDLLLALKTRTDFDAEDLPQRLSRRSRNWTPVTMV
jgi:hypothetical protein